MSSNLKVKRGVGIYLGENFIRIAQLPPTVVRNATHKVPGPCRNDATLRDEHGNMRKHKETIRLWIAVSQEYHAWGSHLSPWRGGPLRPWPIDQLLRGDNQTKKIQRHRPLDVGKGRGIPVTSFRICSRVSVKGG